uniref:Uncharacterized protein n=1 Tax=Anguilla anguilla TaxID=7936 RepID=A0A0E9TR60_ANGAN
MSVIYLVYNCQLYSPVPMYFGVSFIFRFR